MAWTRFPYLSNSLSATAITVLDPAVMVFAPQSAVLVINVVKDDISGAGAHCTLLGDKQCSPR